MVSETILYKKDPFNITWDSRATDGRPLRVNGIGVTPVVVKAICELVVASEGMAKQRHTSQLLEALKNGGRGMPGRSNFERVDALVGAVREAAYRGLINPRLVANPRPKASPLPNFTPQPDARPVSQVPQGPRRTGTLPVVLTTTP